MEHPALGPLQPPLHRHPAALLGADAGQVAGLVQALDQRLRADAEAVLGVHLAGGAEGRSPVQVEIAAVQPADTVALGLPAALHRRLAGRGRAQPAAAAPAGVGAECAAGLRQPGRGRRRGRAPRVIGEGAATAPLPGPLKILAALGAPDETRTGNAPLDVEAEMQAILDAVAGLGEGAAQVRILEVGHHHQIAAALQAEQYHALHLSAHGSETGVELEDEDGSPVWVEAKDLMATLRAGERPPPLVVLSSCEGAAGGGDGLAARLVRRRADRVRSALRGGEAAVRRLGAWSGVVLTGIGGIGKMAGRLVSRLREEGWLAAVHTGRWNPPALTAAVADALDGRPGLERARALLLDAGVEDTARLALVAELLRRARLLVLFDDFEQNLARGREGFLDPGFAEVFGGLCLAAGQGRLLVTCRYPLPGEAADSLLEVPVDPLSRSELGRLLLRMPALGDLAHEDRRAVERMIGGHPRLVELLNALLRGGRANLAEVTRRLRRLARERGASLEGDRSVAEAIDEAVLLGSRDREHLAWLEARIGAGDPATEAVRAKLNAMTDGQG